MLFLEVPVQHRGGRDRGLEHSLLRLILTPCTLVHSYTQSRTDALPRHVQTCMHTHTHMRTHTHTHTRARTRRELQGEFDEPPGTSGRGRDGGRDGWRERDHERGSGFDRGRDGAGGPPHRDREDDPCALYVGYISPQVGCVWGGGGGARWPAFVCTGWCTSVCVCVRARARALALSQRTTPGLSPQVDEHELRHLLHTHARAHTQSRTHTRARAGGTVYARSTLTPTRCRWTSTSCATCSPALGRSWTAASFLTGV